MGLLSLAVALVVALPIVLADATHQFRLKQDKSASSELVTLVNHKKTDPSAPSRMLGRVPRRSDQQLHSSRSRLQLSDIHQAEL